MVEDSNAISRYIFSRKFLKYTLQFVMIGVFSGIRSKRPFQTPDKTLLTVTLCMLDKFHIFVMYKVSRLF